MNRRNLFKLIIFGVFLLFLGQCNSANAYEYYSFSKELSENERLYKIPLNLATPTYTQEWTEPKFSNSQNNTTQSNYGNGSSGSTYFIYTQSQSPSYCIPGSSYAICH